MTDLDEHTSAAAPASETYETTSALDMPLLPSTIIEGGRPERTGPSRSRRSACLGPIVQHSTEAPSPGTVVDPSSRPSLHSPQELPASG